MHTAPYEDPGKWAAAFLAIVMHALLAAALLFSVRWQTRHEPVVAELWTPQQMPQVIEAAPVEPPPEAVAEAPLPAAKAAPAEAPALPPDIRLKADKKPKEKPPEAPKSKASSFSDLLAREETQLDRRKADLAQQKRLEDEQRLLKQVSEDQERAQRSAARAKSEADYISRIQGKIRGNLVQPPNLKGNPVAHFMVTQLPTGEVLEVKLRRASGNPQYDDAVERAIRKSSPLPRPNDASVFARDLVLTFCPDEERGCSR